MRSSRLVVTLATMMSFALISLQVSPADAHPNVTRPVPAVKRGVPSRTVRALRVNHQAIGQRAHRRVRGKPRIFYGNFRHAYQQLSHSTVGNSPSKQKHGARPLILQPISSHAVNGHTRLHSFDSGTTCPTSTGWVCADMQGDNPAGGVISWNGSSSSLSSLSIGAGGGRFIVYQTTPNSSFTLTADLTAFHATCIYSLQSLANCNAGLMLRSGTGDHDAFYYLGLQGYGESSPGSIFVNYQAENGGTVQNSATIPINEQSALPGANDPLTCSVDSGNCYLRIERRMRPVVPTSAIGLRSGRVSGE